MGYLENLDDLINASQSPQEPFRDSTSWLKDLSAERLAEMRYQGSKALEIRRASDIDRDRGVPILLQRYPPSVMDKLRSYLPPDKWACAFNMLTAPAMEGRQLTPQEIDHIFLAFLTPERRIAPEIRAGYPIPWLHRFAINLVVSTQLILDTPNTNNPNLQRAQESIYELGSLGIQPQRLVRALQYTFGALG